MDPCEDEPVQDACWPLWDLREQVRLRYLFVPLLDGVVDVDVDDER